MNDKEYIESLENLLIFTCDTLEKQQKVLFELFQEGNDAYIKIPTIQGSRNRIPIAQLGKLDFANPKHGYQEVYDEITKKRGK